MSVFKRRTQKQRRPVRRQQQRAEPILKSPREIQIMREAGRIVARVHMTLKEAIRPGVSTWELDNIAAEVSTTATLSTDRTSGELHRRHHVTPNGFYRGRKIISEPAAVDSED